MSKSANKTYIESRKVYDDGFIYVRVFCLQFGPSLKAGSGIHLLALSQDKIRI